MTDQEIIDKIIKFRAKHKLTQSKMADLFSISQAHLSIILSKKQRISTARRSVILAVFDMLESGEIPIPT